MSEPKPVAAGIEAARRALERATPPPSIDPSPVDEDDLIELRRARDEGIDSFRRTRWSAMCPQRFVNVSLDWTRSEHGDDVADTIIEWTQLAPRPNLVLLGPVGTGKTGAAVAACRADWFEHSVDMTFLPLVELLDLLRPGGPDSAFADLVDAERLIIDDIGTERPTDWTRERLDAVVNRRWLEESPTIVTSNLNADNLRNAVGERLWSRLAGGDAYVVPLLGNDRRKP